MAFDGVTRKPIVQPDSELPAQGGSFGNGGTDPGTDVPPSNVAGGISSLVAQSKQYQEPDEPSRAQQTAATAGRGLDVARKSLERFGIGSEGTLGKLGTLSQGLQGYERGSKAEGEAKEKLKKELSDRLQKKATKEISKRIENKVLKKGLEKGTEKIVQQGTKRAVQGAAKEAAKTAAKAGTKIATSAGTKVAAGAAVEATAVTAIEAAGVAAGAVSFGLGFVLSTLLSIAISLGISDAVDATFELAHGDVKKATFLAIRAAMKVGMFLALLATAVQVFTVVGLLTGIPTLIGLNAYMIWGMIWKSNPFFQGFVWWEKFIIIVLDVICIVITFVFVAAILWQTCQTYQLGGVLGTIAGGAERVISGTGYLAEFNEVCKQLTNLGSSPTPAP